jgi:hypothetical protein
MFSFLLPSDPLRHPRQLPPRVFDLALRLFLLRASHLRHGRGEAPASAMQNRNRHL